MIHLKPTSNVKISSSPTGTSFFFTFCDWRCWASSTTLVLKRGNFHTNFHLNWKMSLWNHSALALNTVLSSFGSCATSLLFTPWSWMLCRHCCHLRSYFDRCNKAPLPWSQVNNSSWLMFVFPYTFLLFDLVCPIPLSFFFLPVYTQYTSRRVCARSHSWPPLSVCSSLDTSPPNNSSSPSHLTLSLPLFLCGD